MRECHALVGMVKFCCRYHLRFPIFPATETMNKESSEPGRPDYHLVRTELGNVLTGSTFRRSVRLSRCLEYVVERSLAGEANELKEYRIGWMSSSAWRPMIHEPIPDVATCPECRII